MDSLVEEVRQGSPEAFRELFSRYWRDMYITAYRRVKNQQEAEDIVQEVFTSLWERRERLEIGGPVENYLHKAVKYQVIKWIDQNRRRADAVEHLFRRMSLMEETIINSLQAAEMKETIAKTIEEFPENMKKIFLLRAEEYTVAEIAEALGLAEQTVKNNTTGALNRLRIVLSRSHPEMGRSLYTFLSLLL